MALTQEQKDLKRLAKRIVKAVKEPLEEAMKKEADIRGIELEEQLRKLDQMGLFASANSKALDDGEDDMETIRSRRRTGSDASAVAGASPGNHTNDDVDMPDADAQPTGQRSPALNDKQQPPYQAASHASSMPDRSTKGRGGKATGPLSPPASHASSAGNGGSASASGDSHKSSEDAHDVFAQGGVPWYLEPFDPVGTTIHDERYTGRAVLRAMSEELSDMDEDTLTELAVTGTPNGSRAPMVNGSASTSMPATTRKASSRKKRPKRSHWSR